MTDFLMNTYARVSTGFTHGKGVYLYDEDGTAYLDGAAGIAVNALGYSHPALLSALHEQIDRLLHTSNIYQIPAQQALGKRLVELSGLCNAFFCSSGAEATETMLKLARKFARRKDIQEPKIIVMDNAFHGRTLATLSASGSRRVQGGFEPLVQGFLRVPFNDLDAIHAIAKHHKDVVAVMLEPIQGEGGLHVPQATYLKSLRAICDEHDWLLMLDEVQSGIGRTGKFFCFEHSGILPDVMALAKGLGGGIPIGACLAGERAKDLFEIGNHGSTFGGNPLACVAGLTVLDIIEKEDILGNVRKTADYFFRRLKTELSGNPHVVDIRGQGLWIGVETDAPARPLLEKGIKERILFSVAAEKVVRITPPLIFKPEHVDIFVAALRRVLE